jgi:ubiquitin carboxyl-terminal hydrolase 22/27/51
MGEFLEKARKMTLANYRNILQRIHDLPSIIAQTHKGDGRSLVSLRPTYLCLQCPTISTEAERDQHGESKAHCFCGWQHVAMDGYGLT